jgi:hypothetical protein
MRLAWPVGGREWEREKGDVESAGVRDSLLSTLSTTTSPLFSKQMVKRCRVTDRPGVCLPLYHHSICSDQLFVCVALTRSTGWAGEPWT